jgi:tetratricopeptide (TPR) repeat protein
VPRSSRATPTALPDRIARARSEGRTQQALELTRQFVKQSPSPDHDELLRQVLLERGTQLRQQGHTRDAATVFANALGHGGSPEYRARIAEHLADCGDPVHAMQAIGPDTDPKLVLRVVGHVADLALRKGPGGKSLLPAELHAGFDAVTQAFAHSETGRDEEARAALQAIGLSSPFLEWKLLVRGLLAYYARDEARALENWQRLDPHRIPARLAAPLRSGIDPAFRQAQAPAMQNALTQVASRLAGSDGMVARLEALKRSLNDKESLGPAFRQAEPIVTELQRDRPALVRRLADSFFWAIVHHGQPEDLDRYRRVFRAQATPIEMGRLEALAVEERGMFREAHRAWQDVVRALAQEPPDWPTGAAKRAQALVWEHMGHNAAEQGEQPDGFPLYFEKPKPLKPGAVECFERSIKLAPDRLEPYLALFETHCDSDKIDKARKVGEQLLERFPDHAATSEALGELMLQTQEPAKAREYFAKALAANPLERRLRGKLARARQNLALERTLAGDFDAGRAEYEAALALHEGSPTALLCQWAVLEMKAGQPERATERIGRADVLGQRLAVRYALVSESVRAKLPPAERKRIAADLTAALAQTPTPAEVLSLLEAAAGQRLRQLDAFRGQKTHERSFLRFLDTIPLREFSETELQKLCGCLQALDARKPWQQCLEYAERCFPENPTFPLSRFDFLLSRKSGSATWQLGDALDRARALVQALPREQQERFLPFLRQRQQQVESLGGPGRGAMHVLEEMFDSFGGPDAFDEEDW